MPSFKPYKETIFLIEECKLHLKGVGRPFHTTTANVLIMLAVRLAYIPAFPESHLENNHFNSRHSYSKREPHESIGPT